MQPRVGGTKITFQKLAPDGNAAAEQTVVFRNRMACVPEKGAIAGGKLNCAIAQYRRICKCIDKQRVLDSRRGLSIDNSIGCCRNNRQIGEYAIRNRAGRNFHRAAGNLARISQAHMREGSCIDRKRLVRETVAVTENRFFAASLQNDRFAGGIGHSQRFGECVIASAGHCRVAFVQAEQQAC